jgi:putative DNA primase/helicase
VFGDWNDAFMQKGEEATRKAIYDAIRPPAQSPFDTMSEAEFTAMSASDKAMRVHEHYGEALAVDANGQLLSRYENGIWKIIPPSLFPAMWLFQRLRAPFSSGRIASVVETLKLIIPQQDTGTPSDWFSQRGTRYPKRPIQPAQQIALAAHAVRRGFYPAGGRGNAGNPRAEFLALARPCGRWQPQKRDVILAALFMVLANRYDWQLFLEVTGPGGSGKSILAEIATLLAGKITPRRPISTRWKTRASVPPDWLLADTSA